MRGGAAQFGHETVVQRLAIESMTRCHVDVLQGCTAIRLGQAHPDRPWHGRGEVNHRSKRIDENVVKCGGIDGGDDAGSC